MCASGGGRVIVRAHEGVRLLAWRREHGLSTDDDFYAAAERRIWRLQAAIAAVGAGVAWWLAGAGAAAAFLVGAAISSLNFLWLKQAVDALVEKATGAETRTARRRRRLLVWKFIGRYALIGAAAYAILKHTAWNIEALLSGLFLFVAAILAEIVFEIVTGWTSDRHGT